MIGTIGVDLQRHRATIGLMEWSGGRPRYGSVGDGRRMVVPIAATASAWGSPAAEAVLAARPAGAPLAESLYAWRQDPWPEFVGGLRTRLLNYLGQPPTAHQISLCIDPPDVPADAADRLDAAGLPGVEIVTPLDALLCRWLSATPAPPSAPVIVIAVGEVATHIGSYTVEAGSPPSVRRGAVTRLDVGADRWTSEIARRVLGLCRPGVPARALLSLLDGVDEFAALVRAAPRDDTPVQWTGPLSQHMFSPLRTTRRDLVGDPAAAAMTVPIVSAVRRMIGSGATPAALIVGGPGAAWPFAAAALALIAPVWTSGDPLLDLAAGACWWGPLQPAFRAAPVDLSGRTRSPRAADRTVPAPVAASPGGDDALPWESR